MPGVDRDAFVNNAAQNAIEGRDDRLAGDGGDCLPFPDAIADGEIRLNATRPGRAQNPCGCFPGDLARRTGVGFGGALPDAAAQVMPAIGFDHGVDIDSGAESRSQADHQRGIGDACAEVALGHARIDDDRRAQRRNRRAFFIDQDGDGVLRDGWKDVVSGSNQAGVYAFDGDLTLVDGGAVANRASD